MGCSCSSAKGVQVVKATQVDAPVQTSPRSTSDEDDQIQNESAEASELCNTGTNTNESLQDVSSNDDVTPDRDVNDSGGADTRKLLQSKRRPVATVSNGPRLNRPKHKPADTSTVENNIKNKNTKNNRIFPEDKNTSSSNSRVNKTSANNKSSFKKPKSENVPPKTPRRHADMSNVSVESRKSFDNAAYKNDVTSCDQDVQTSEQKKDEFDTRDPRNRPLSAVYGRFRTRAHQTHGVPSNGQRKPIRKTQSEPLPLNHVGHVSRHQCDLSSTGDSSSGDDYDRPKTDRPAVSKRNSRKKLSKVGPRPSWEDKERDESKIEVVGKGAHMHSRGEKSKRPTKKQNESFYLPLDSCVKESPKKKRIPPRKGKAYFLDMNGTYEALGEETENSHSDGSEESGSEISIPDETSSHALHGGRGTFTVGTPVSPATEECEGDPAGSPIARLQQAVREYREGRIAAAQPRTSSQNETHVHAIYQELRHVGELLTSHVLQRATCGTMTQTDYEELVRAYRAEIDRLQDQVIVLQHSLQDSQTQDNSRIRNHSDGDSYDEMTQTDLDEKHDRETSMLETQFAQELSVHPSNITAEDLDTLLKRHFQQREALRRSQLTERQRLTERLQERLHKKTNNNKQSPVHAATNNTKYSPLHTSKKSPVRSVSTQSRTADVEHPDTKEELEQLLHEVATEAAINRRQPLNQEELDQLLTTYREETQRIKNWRAQDKLGFKQRLMEKLAAKTMAKSPGVDSSLGSSSDITGTFVDMNDLREIQTQTDAITQNLQDMDEKFVQTMNKVQERDVTETDVQNLIQNHIRDTEELRKQKYRDMMGHKDRLGQLLLQKRNATSSENESLSQTDEFNENGEASVDKAVQAMLHETSVSTRDLERRIREGASVEELTRLLAEHRERQKFFIQHQLLTRLTAQEAIDGKLRQTIDPRSSLSHVEVQFDEEEDVFKQQEEDTALSDPVKKKEVDKEMVQQLFDEHEQEVSSLREQRKRDASHHRRRLLEKLACKKKAQSDNLEEQDTSDHEPAEKDATQEEPNTPTPNTIQHTFRRIDQERLRQQIEEKRAMGKGHTLKKHPSQTSDIGSSLVDDDTPSDPSSSTGASCSSMTDDMTADEKHLVESDDDAGMQWSYYQPRRQKTTQACDTYSHIDEYVNSLQIEASTSLPAVAQTLLGIAETELEKARALYTWLLIQTRRLESTDRDVNKALQQLHSQDLTYAHFYQELARHANLKCHVINGRRKDVTDEAEYRKLTWNILELSDGAHIINLEGACSGDIYASEYFFCPSPETYINTHLPDEEKWQILRPAVSEKQFRRALKTWPLFYKYNFKAIDPEILGGVIETRDPSVAIRVYVDDHLVDCTLVSSEGHGDGDDSLEDCVEQHTLNLLEEEEFKLVLPKCGDYYFTVYIIDPCGDKLHPACQYIIKFRK